MVTRRPGLKTKYQNITALNLCQKVLDSLSKVEFYAATTDMWSSRGMTPCMGCTIHCISGNLPVVAGQVVTSKRVLLKPNKANMLVFTC